VESDIKTYGPMSLEEFLKLPQEAPYLEYIDGIVEQKPMPGTWHAFLQSAMVEALNRYARPRGLGWAFGELECQYAGRVIIPDVVFLTWSHVETDANGEFVDDTLIPPDIHVEITSPDRDMERSRERLTHSTSNGCAMGWHINPYAMTIDVFLPNRPPERLPACGVFVGDPVLPGFRLPVGEVFDWLRPSW
jgi:Uma2 family endonuclease